MKIDLLPCPFCGGETARPRKDDGEPRMVCMWFITCHSPNCGGEVGGFLTEAEAKLAWNRRAAAPSQEAPRSEWIAVSERLPIKPGEQFVYCTTKYTTILYYLDGGWLESDKQLNDDKDRARDYWNKFVTHWMPLPSPPKQ